MAGEKKSKMSAINIFFIFFVVTSILYGAATGRLKEVTDASFESAKGSVSLAINLIGIMALWLGFIRILEAGGLMYSLANLVRPLVKRIFPDVPAGHPAMGAMLLNMSANALGLGNAATPLGLKAMTELDKLNPFKGTATNAMCLFLAINTSGLTLLPLGVIGVRVAAGSTYPADIFIPTLIATFCSTVMAILSAYFFTLKDKKYLTEFNEAKNILTENIETSQTSYQNENEYKNLLLDPSKLSRFVTLSIIFCFISILIYKLYSIFIETVPTSINTFLGINIEIWHNWKTFIVNDFISFWILPFLMLAIFCFGLWKGVKIYDAVTDGAKQGFDIAIKIIPFLVAILVAIGMFRASGAMDLLISFLDPITTRIGLPAEVLPMAILRPLSGSGAFAVMSEIVVNDPNSYSAFVASVLNGCTETTFYVLAVYFGSIGVVRVRHALICGLLADITGVIAATLTSGFFYR